MYKFFVIQNPGKHYESNEKIQEFFEIGDTEDSMNKICKGRLYCIGKYRITTTQNYPRIKSDN